MARANRLYSTAEAAAFLKMSVPAFSSYVRRHHVNFVRVDHHRRFTLDTLIAVKVARVRKNRS